MDELKKADKRWLKKLIKEVGWDAFSIDELNEMLTGIREAIRKKESQQNENRVLLDIAEEIYEILDEIDKTPAHIWDTWTKRVTGLDKTKASGYSLLGEFVTQSAHKKSYWNKGDIFVHCIHEGTWKRRWKSYGLYYINDDGKLELIARDTTRDYAINFWDPIEKLLNGKKPEQKE